MIDVSYITAPCPVRADIEEAHTFFWQKLAAPGTWWTGAERVAIGAEVRQAHHCQLCQERKAALSPTAIQGTHDTGGVLPETAVEMIHRVTTDPGRLSKRWYDDLLAQGLSDTHYVEALGVVGRTVSVDSFCRGLGLPLHPLPTPVAGEPSRRRPLEATLDGAWVPMVPNGQANVIRALSLVPVEVHLSIEVLLPVQYMEISEVRNLSSDPGRAISRSQIELLAARVSALNQCFY